MFGWFKEKPLVARMREGYYEFYGRYGKPPSHILLSVNQMKEYDEALEAQARYVDRESHDLLFMSSKVVPVLGMYGPAFVNLDKESKHGIYENT